MKVYIKYMVSARCQTIVRTELEKLGVESQYVLIDLGMVEISQDITPEQRRQLKMNLRRTGLEVLDNKKSVLIDKVKDLITEMIHHSDELPKVNYSDHISEKMKYDYTYISNLFSEVKGITIQQYIIVHRIERVKGLLLHEDLSLTEIAYRMHYSSVAHLSNQFKKITGLSPKFYKQLQQKRNRKLKAPNMAA